MRFAQIITMVALLWLCGCSGEGFGDPCSWLPEPNQEAAVFILSDFQETAVDLLFDVLELEDAITQAEVTMNFRPALFANNSPNVFEPTPEEVSLCLDDLLDQVYGPQ